tara:strand:+ start:776 stop:1699 length:924 start_codon:yes stop_codon:yes gene_type:complete
MDTILDKSIPSVLINDIVNGGDKTLILDYDEIISECEVYLSNTGKTDINFIITVKNRLDFAKPMYDSFLAAKNSSDLNISYTVVELSDYGEHKSYCINNGINYIWYKYTKSLEFNKCLGLNLGAILSNKSDSFLFHDIDCVIKSDFFNKLKENIEQKKSKAIQCFHGGRVLYLNDDLTNQVINEKTKVDSLSLDVNGVSEPVCFGATGGSIYVEKDLFFEIGGYDPELFYGYAPEDTFFWSKIDLIETMHISDNPKIDIFHMNHKSMSLTNPELDYMLSLCRKFNSMSLDDKLNLIKIKRDIIKKFY